MLLKRYEVYSISEFMNRETSSKLSMLESTLEHLKRNHKKYLMLVIAVAVTMDLSGITLINTTVVAATDLENLLSPKAAMIVEQLIFLARYVCMGLGLKDMIITMLNGGNMKEATFSGIQYWLIFLFLQFYPSLYN